MTQTIDRELIELAAKAAGIEGKWAEWDHAYGDYRERGIDYGGRTLWNPLDNDSDALRLAVKLNLFQEPAFTLYGLIPASIEQDPYAATRRAIVRAVLKQKCPCGATEQSQVDECAYANCAMVNRCDEQEPVAWQKRIYTTEGDWGEWEEIKSPNAKKWGMPEHTNLSYWQNEVRLSNAPSRAHSGSVQIRPLYSNPQPLTDEWIRMIYDECDAETGDEFIFAFARDIERAHGIG